MSSSLGLGNSEILKFLATVDRMAQRGCCSTGRFSSCSFPARLNVPHSVPQNALYCVLRTRLPWNWQFGRPKAAGSQPIQSRYSEDFLKEELPGVLIRHSPQRQAFLRAWNDRFSRVGSSQRFPANAQCSGSSTHPQLQCCHAQLQSRTSQIQQEPATIRSSQQRACGGCHLQSWE